MITGARGSTAKKIIVAIGIIEDCKDDPDADRVLATARRLGWPIDEAREEVEKQTGAIFRRYIEEAGK
jgi:hypothetical protein